MRKIIATEFITLDGVVEDPHLWPSYFSYFNAAIAQYKRDELFTSDIQLLGRVTYDAFAATWPNRKGDEFADRFNSLPKVVVSKTLNNANWQNSTIIKDNVYEEIARLKQTQGDDILIHGSITLVNKLLQQQLVDLMKLMIFPLVVGKGMRMFEEGSNATMKHKETVTFETGVVAVHYEPEKK